MLSGSQSHLWLVLTLMLRKKSIALLSLATTFQCFTEGCDSKTSSSSNTSPAARVTELPAVDRVDSTEGPDVGGKQTRQPTRKLPSSKVESNVTLEEASVFATNLQNAILTNNLPQFEKLIDWEGIVARAVEGDGFETAFRESIATPAMASTLAKNSLASIQNLCEGKGSYRIVRVTSRGGKQHVVFRGVSSQSDMNFHDFQIEKKGDRVIATRFFVALIGEEISDSLHKNFMVAQKQTSVVQQFTGQASEPIQDLMLVAEMSNKFRANDKAGSIASYDKLSSNGKKTKMAMLLRLNALSSVDEARYLTAWDEYVSAFADDPSLGLSGINAAVLRGDLKQLDKCREILQQWTGGDPYVDLICSRWFLELGEKERGKELFDPIDVDALDLANADEIALINYLLLDENAKVLAQLKKLKAKYNKVFAKVEGAEYFNRFELTDEYKSWKSFIRSNNN